MRQLTDADGTVTRAAAYSPYGEVLYAAGGGQTAYGFTNEYTDAAGLTYLRARHYSAAMGRFMTRDTWEGNANSPMTYNAWLYVNGDPINFTDPSGQFASEYLDFTYENGYSANQEQWSDDAEQALDESAQAVGRALANTINNVIVPEYRKIPHWGPWLEPFIRVVTPLEAFKQVYGGKVELRRIAMENPGVWGWTKGSRLIWVYTNATSATLSNPVYSRWLAHELGHAFESTVNGTSLGTFYRDRWAFQLRRFLDGNNCNGLNNLVLH